MDQKEALVKRDDFTPFLLFDRLDDELIIRELEGQLPDVLTYHFKDPDTGKEIWGISKAGVDEAKAELGKRGGEVIREMEVMHSDKDDEAYFTVKAGRYVVSKEGKEILLDTAFGFKRQPKKTPKGRPNPFWFEQGAIKAARNASSRLIPKSVIQGIIELGKASGKVKEARPQEENGPVASPQGALNKFPVSPEQEAELTPPLTPLGKFLFSMAAEKTRVGVDNYYETLQLFGFAHANEIKEREKQVAVYKALKNYQ